MTALVVAGLLLGHALMHLSYLAPQPVARPGSPAWPFHLDRSWLLGPSRFSREMAPALGKGLVLIVIAAFGLGAASALGVGPEWLWSAGVTLGAIASLVVLTVFFDRLLVLGIAIDLVILWAIAVAAWAPTGL